MEQRILVCDYCPGARRRPAVARYGLTNGRGIVPVATLDLCKLHQGQLLRAFKPKGKQPALPSSKEALAERTALVLAYLKQHRGPHGRSEIAQALGLKPHSVTDVFRRVDRKQVKPSGVGRSRAYEWRA